MTTSNKALLKASAKAQYDSMLEIYSNNELTVDEKIAARNYSNVLSEMARYDSIRIKKDNDLLRKITIFNDNLYRKYVK